MTIGIYTRNDNTAQTIKKKIQSSFSKEHFNFIAFTNQANMMDSLRDSNLVYQYTYIEYELSARLFTKSLQFLKLLNIP